VKTAYVPARIWDEPPQGGHEAFLRALFAPTGGDRRSTVFFRADDCGVPGANFRRLVDTFAAHGAPLCMAVVPCWLPMHAAGFRSCLDIENPLWCLHMHGFRHVNLEQSGQKMEFGPARSREDIRQRLERGRSLLEAHLGAAFQPVFTPPWNNGCAEALEELAELGCSGVSRCQ